MKAGSKQNFRKFGYFNCLDQPKEGTTEEIANETVTTQIATTAPAATLKNSPAPTIQKTTMKKTTKPKASKITAVKLPQTSPTSIPEAAEPILPSEPKSGAPLIDVETQSVELHNYYRSLEHASNMLYMVSPHLNLFLPRNLFVQRKFPNEFSFKIPLDPRRCPRTYNENSFILE